MNRRIYFANRKSYYAPKEGEVFWGCAYEYAYSGVKCTLKVEPTKVCIKNGHVVKAKNSKLFNRYDFKAFDTEDQCKSYYNNRLRSHADNVLLSLSVVINATKELLRKCSSKDQEELGRKFHEIIS
jgi:hypothetical protein